MIQCCTNILLDKKLTYENCGCTVIMITIKATIFVSRKLLFIILAIIMKLNQVGLYETNKNIVLHGPAQFTNFKPL